MPGWSIFTPILTLPASASLAIVVPASNVLAASSSAFGARLLLAAATRGEREREPRVASIVARRVRILMVIGRPLLSVGAQWLRIFDRKSFARSLRGSVKNSSGERSSTIRPRP